MSLEILFDTGSDSVRSSYRSCFLISVSFHVAWPQPPLYLFHNAFHHNLRMLPPWSPEEGSLGFFFLSFGVSGHRGSSDMTLIFLQVKMMWEMYQMPKWSQRDDLTKAMIGGRSDPKPKIK